MGDSGRPLIGNPSSTPSPARPTNGRSGKKVITAPVQEESDPPADEKAAAAADVKELCRDFGKGRCNRGDQCPYRHVTDDSGKKKTDKKLLEKRAKTPCNNWAKGSCRFGDKCQFLHEADPPVTQVCCRQEKGSSSPRSPTLAALMTSLMKTPKAR